MSDSPERGAPVLDAAIDLLRSRGSTGILPVQGTSMLPFLKVGSRVLVEFVDPAPERLRRGDLILFRQGGHVVVHRLVARTRGGLRTRGDNRAHLDPPVGDDQVLGRIVATGEDATWYDIRTGLARFHAWNLANHNLVWSWLSDCASWMDRGLARIGLRPVVFRCVRALDALNMRLAHALLFGLVHRRIPEPEARSVDPPG